MNNYFQQKKRTASLKPKNIEKSNAALNNSFNDRRQHFIQSLDPAFANCLLNGLYPTSKIPRETNKPITLSKFLTNDQRIQYIVEDFSQSHLPRELYAEGPKIKLRERVQSLEGPQWSYENRPKLRKDQANQANQYNKSIIDDTAKDMTMVYFPQWKTHSKDKWKTERGFLTTVYPKPTEPQYFTDVYIEGFEALGDFSRKFEKMSSIPKISDAQSNQLMNPSHQFQSEKPYKIVFTTNYFTKIQTLQISAPILDILKFIINLQGRRSFLQQKVDQK